MKQEPLCEKKLLRFFSLSHHGAHQSLAKQILSCDLALHKTCIYIAGNAVRRNEGDVECFLCLRFISKQFTAIVHFLTIYSRNSIRSTRIFHFAKVDDAILAIDEQINLSAFPHRSITGLLLSTIPRTHIAQHTANAKSLLEKVIAKTKASISAIIIFF